MSLLIENLSLTKTKGFALNVHCLELENERFVGLIGQNGAGKSTLLKCLLGLLSYQGKVFYKDLEVRKLSAKKRAEIFSYLPQNKPNNSEFSVEDFVGMSFYKEQNFFSRHNKNTKLKIQEMLELCQCEKLSKQKLQELSGGELQKVLLSAALAQNAEYLLLDEPSSSLDPKSEKTFFELCARIKSEKKQKIICCTHAINQISGLCDKVLAIKDGELVIAGSSPEVFNKTRLKEIFDLDFFPARQEHIGRTYFFT